MNNQKNNDEWNRLKNKLRQKYGHHMYSEGTGEELLGRLREKTGKTHDNIRKIIENIK